MDAQTAIAELEELAKKLNIDVNYDKFTGEGTKTGGLCKVKGRWRLIIEKRSANTEKVSMLARTLARFDTEEHFVSPAVRNLLERYRPEDENRLAML